MLKERRIFCWRGSGLLNWAWVGLDALQSPLKPFPFLIPGLSRQDKGPGLCWRAGLFCTPTLSHRLQIKVLPKMYPPRPLLLQ